MAGGGRVAHPQHRNPSGFSLPWRGDGADGGGGSRSARAQGVTDDSGGQALQSGGPPAVPQVRLRGKAAAPQLLWARGGCAGDGTDDRLMEIYANSAKIA